MKSVSVAVRTKGNNETPRHTTKLVGSFDYEEIYEPRLLISVAQLPKRIICARVLAQKSVIGRSILVGANTLTREPNLFDIHYLRARPSILKTRTFSSNPLSIQIVPPDVRLIPTMRVRLSTIGTLTHMLNLLSEARPRLPLSLKVLDRKL